MNYLKDDLDEGWSIQIYGRDRRLLYSFYPSHGWTFLGGLFMGFMLTLMVMCHQASNVSSTPPPANSESNSNLHTPLLQID
jgi:hypothetical protein